ncbi:MAG: hypothetical protein A3F83_03500 [Candidatus Glassbacteria bacterium RIFCSPLOWO2_12_FULL_58_11]|uniref:RDD domain-containing protein n=1 Tax=Candidatus Glassbacteria bacterium RIFCSPLOWO2_12_FULL_58_11 TaxID=1817867 RepID=A0A1F5YX37_9BACT|nr:MAG: hypothetical protein A3F83_03500 [Candidatus Glassbacteria bacterium RIFCSPLOWO2_12_FULL_58_11]
MLPTRYASFFKRLVAHILDVLFATTISGIIVIPLGILGFGGTLFSGLMFHHWWPFEPHFNAWDFLKGMMVTLPIAGILIGALVFTVLYWFYFAIFESGPRQATPGKMLVGVFVTDQFGRRISFPRALGRTVGKVLSHMFCYLGYLAALFSQRNQALHDMLAGTLVLEPEYPPPPMVSYNSQAGSTPPPTVSGPVGQQNA